jgi:hypothetical protein
MAVQGDVQLQHFETFWNRQPVDTAQVSFPTQEINLKTRAPSVLCNIHEIFGGFNVPIGDLSPDVIVLAIPFEILGG